MPARIIAAFALIALCVAAPPARAACEIGPAASFPFDRAAGHLLVTTVLDGQDARMLLDTGAARTVIDEAAVSRLGLPLSEWAAMTLRGAGGDVRHRVAELRSLSLGGAPLHRRSATGDMSVGVAPLEAVIGAAGRQSGAEVAGLLGGDFLWGYDLELDGPADRGALHAIRGCGGAFVPWPRPFDVLPAFRPNMDWLIVPVTVDGRTLAAVIDTGAPLSLLTAKGAAELGLSPQHLAGDPTVPVGSIGPNEVTLRRHRFEEVRIGSQTMRDVTLLVGPVQVLRMIDFVLGNDWLAHQHVWLSYATTQVFVSRSAPTVGFGPPEEKPPPAEPKGGEPPASKPASPETP